MKHQMFALSVLALSVLTGCQDQVVEEIAKPLTVSSYEVGAPVQSKFRSFKGQVTPAEQTPIAFRLAGEVQHVLVKAGDVVKKGQLLAKLDDSKEQQALNDAKAQFELSVRQLKRGKDLYSRQMISNAELDELKANQKLAQARYNSAKNQLEYTRLTAPFEGKVSDVSKERFERVSAGEPVVNLYKNDKVYVQIELSDSVLAMINPHGEKGTYTPDVTFSGIDGQFELNYLEHSSEPNAQTKTYELYLTMPQPEHEILPGTSADVTVDMVEAGIASIDGYQVPMTALQAGNNEGNFFVWKYLDGAAHRIPVTVSQITGSGALVTSGVLEGDELINSNLRKLREGKDVKISENN